MQKAVNLVNHFVLFPPQSVLVLGKKTFLRWILAFCANFRPFHANHMSFYAFCVLNFPKQKVYWRQFIRFLRVIALIFMVFLYSIHPYDSVKKGGISSKVIWLMAWICGEDKLLFPSGLGWLVHVEDSSLSLMGFLRPDLKYHKSKTILAPFKFLFNSWGQPHWCMRCIVFHNWFINILMLMLN